MMFIMVLLIMFFNGVDNGFIVNGGGVDIGFNGLGGVNCVVNDIDFIRHVNDVNTGVDLNGFNGVGGVDPDSTLVTI